jgi:hypothetical protein
MKANHLISEIRIQTHTGCEGNGHIGKETKHNGAETRNGRGRGNE